MKLAEPVRRGRLALALLGTLAGAALVGAGCASSPAMLSSGVIHVTFTSDETCGFSNPYTVEANGCRRLDEKAVMCKGFGVIDGVLFAGGCEAPAALEVLETQGTMPLSPPRSEPAEPPPSEETWPAAEPPPEETEVTARKAASKPAKKARSRGSKAKKPKKKPARRKKRSAESAEP